MSDRAPYWVSYRSVVHRTDSRCGGPMAERYRWTPEGALDWDRPCRNCLPDGIPRPMPTDPEERTA